MPIIKSAKKRVKTARKATVRNSKTKRSLKGAVKAFTAAVAGGKKDAAKELSKAQSEIDTAVKKGVMHKNKAARKKAQLAKQAKAAGAKVTGGAKKTAAKAPAKKAAPKKAAPAKKPAAKKAPAKKPAAKK